MITDWKEFFAAAERDRLAGIQPNPVRTACSFPGCNSVTGEPCGRHEMEQAHADGEHAFCGPQCTAGVTL